jgi:hypothetical protein
MSLTMMHETVLHVAQMHPQTWVMVDQSDPEWLSAPRKQRPSHRGTGNL